MWTLRTATEADIPAIWALIPLAVRELSRGIYSEAQIESGLRHVFGVDTQIVRDGSYFVVEEAGEVVGCGGWSRRRTLYGGDQAKDSADPELDPSRDAARIRAFFVHPDRARRGIGAAILRACFEAAAAAGFRELELMATLPGVPLYERHGFAGVEPVTTTLPDGTSISFLRMTRTLAASPEPR